jgi:PEP-CTERM motif
MRLLAKTSALLVSLAAATPAFAGIIYLPNTYGVGGHAAAGDVGAFARWGYNDPNCGLGGSACGTDNRSGTATSSGTADTIGRATTFNANAQSVISGGAIPSATAEADLSKGTVKAFGAAPSGGGYSQSDASAFIYDVLTFSIAGAAADTVTRINFTAVFDGLVGDTGTRDRFNNIPFGFVDGTVIVGENFFSNPFAAHGEVLASAANGFTPTTNLYTRNREGYGSWNASSNVNRMQFDGYVDLVGSQASQFFGIGLNLSCQSGALCDFSHTGAFSFSNLPSNVSFTSASGIFLSALNNPGGVPEPATWGLMIAGFGLTGAAMRRRVGTKVRFA